MGNIHPNSVIQPTFFRKSRAIAKAEAKESLRAAPLHIVHSAAQEDMIDSFEEKKDPSGTHLFAPLKGILHKLGQIGLQDDGLITFPADDVSAFFLEKESDTSALPKKRPNRAANLQEQRARAKNARAKKARAKKAAKKAIRVRKLEAKQDAIDQGQPVRKKQRRRYDHPAKKKAH